MNLGKSQMMQDIYQLFVFNEKYLSQEVVW